MFSKLTSQKEKEDLDGEWIDLIKEAKELGINKEVIVTFLRQKNHQEKVV